MSLLLALALSARADEPALRPGDAMPDRHWDVVALDLSVAIDPVARSVEGTATHTVRPLGRRVGHLRLHQVALDVREVRVDGEIVEGWRLGPDRLDVPMPSLGDEHVVAVTYAATPQTGLHFRGPPDDAYVEVWSQGQDEDNRYWFPTWDYPNDTFAYSAAITAPKDLVVLSNGVRVDRTEHGEQATWRYRLDGPMPAYLVAVAVGPYTVFEADGPVPLEYVAAPGVSEDAMRASLGQTPDLLTWLGERLDEPYPWPVLRQVFVQRFLYGAMENTTLVIHGDFLRAPTDHPDGTYMEEVVAHEIAHQWFGDLVTPYGWRDLWLSEGFAAFYAAEWQRHLRGEAYFAVDVAEWRPKALGDAAAMSPEAIPAGDLAGSAFLMYARGALVLHGLRVWLGEDVFDRAVAAYLDDHRGRLVASSDFQRALEDASGTHLGWWFDTWVHGARFPRAKTTWSWADGALTVEIEQTTEGAPLSAPLILEIGATTPREVRTWLGPGVTRVVVDLPEAPAWVSVDPQGAALVSLDEQQPPAAWVEQLRHSEHPYARLVAMGHLEAAGADGVRALDEALGDDALPAEFRAKAAEALGEIGSADAVADLLSCLDDAHRDVRAACAAALARAPRDEAVTAALSGLWRADPDAAVRAAALKAWAEHDPDAAVAQARKAVEAPLGGTWPHETFAAAEVLGAEGDHRDVARLVALTGTGKPMYVQLTAMHVLSSLVGDLEDEAKRDAARATVSRRFEALLGHEDIRVRGTAVDLLGAMGDEPSAAALAAFAAGCEVPTLAEEAREAATKVRQRAAAGEPEEAPEKPGEPTDVQRLQERVQALEERLKRLEDWRY